MATRGHSKLVVLHVLLLISVDVAAEVLVALSHFLVGLDAPEVC